MTKNVVTRFLNVRLAQAAAIEPLLRRGIDSLPTAFGCRLMSRSDPPPEFRSAVRRADAIRSLVTEGVHPERARMQVDGPPPAPRTLETVAREMRHVTAQAATLRVDLPYSEPEQRAAMVRRLEELGRRQALLQSEYGDLVADAERAAADRDRVEFSPPVPGQVV